MTSFKIFALFINTIMSCFDLVHDIGARIIEADNR